MRTTPFSPAHPHPPHSHLFPSRSTAILSCILGFRPRTPNFSTSPPKLLILTWMPTSWPRWAWEYPKLRVTKIFYFSGSIVLYQLTDDRVPALETVFGLLLRDLCLDYLLVVLVLRPSTPSILSQAHVGWSHMCMTQLGTRIS